MYTIYALANGRFACVGLLQDGTERWECETLTEAVHRMRRFASVMNGVKIKRRDIRFLRPVQVVETQWEEFK